MNQILTAGYSGHTPKQLRAAADALGNAYIVDIRFSPFSRVPGWNGTELRTLFGKHYVHLQSLGNKLYGAGRIEIANLSGGMVTLGHMAKERPCILLCGCANYAECHRAHIANLMKPAGWQIEELQWPELAEAGFYKCLSLWQPWATLIAIRAKLIETRGWATAYRGPLVIHAAKNKSELALCRTGLFREVLHKAKITDPSQLPLGAAVALVDLLDCQPTEKLISTISAQERAFGGYGPGRFGFLLGNVRPFHEPVPLRGAQGFFNIDADLLEGKF